MFVGPAPTGMTAAIRFVSGSMTATEFGTAARMPVLSSAPVKAKTAANDAAPRRSAPPIAIKRAPFRRTAPTTRRWACWRVELLVMAENGLLELLQLAARLEPELAVEIGPRLLVPLERVGLTAGAVQREHELRPQTLAQRLLEHERFELGHERGMAAESKVGLDPQLERRQAELLQPGDLGLGEGLGLEICKRWAPPESERVPERAGCTSGVACREQTPAGLEQPLEALGVELIRRQPEQVAAASRLEHALADHLPQLRHVDLQALDRGGWRLLTPQPVH